MELFNQNLTEFTFFYQHFSPSYDVMLTEVKNLEFVHGVHFYFIKSLKNNGTMYLLTFEDSCEQNCNLKAFVDFATAGRHHGLSAIHIKRNPFH